MIFALQAYQSLNLYASNLSANLQHFASAFSPEDFLSIIEAQCAVFISVYEYF